MAKILANQHDIMALQSLALLDVGYLPHSGASMRPAAIRYLVNEIVLGEHETILELGSGLSTVYMAAALRNDEARLISVDHDEKWLATVRRWLEARQLGDRVNLVHAPLIALQESPPAARWYDPGPICAALGNDLVDFLVVDGPPARSAETEHARMPATDVLRSRFAEHYTIVLDDILRPGEARIVREWEHRLGIRFERRTISGGIAIGRTISDLVL